MRTGSPWLDCLKETLEEEPRSPRENFRRPTVPTVQNMRKSEEKARGKVVNMNTARVPRTEDEHRLISADWSPKERMGLIIWANPETGFYYSQEIALHCLDQSTNEEGKA